MFVVASAIIGSALGLAVLARCGYHLSVSPLPGTSAASRQLLIPLQCAPASEVSPTPVSHWKFSRYQMAATSAQEEAALTPAAHNRHQLKTSSDRI